MNFKALDSDHTAFRFSTSKGLQGPFDGGGVRNAVRSLVARTPEITNNAAVVVLDLWDSVKLISYLDFIRIVLRRSANKVVTDQFDDRV